MRHTSLVIPMTDHMYGLCGYGLCNYGLYSHGADSYGVYSNGLYSYGLYSYGLYTLWDASPRIPASMSLTVRIPTRVRVRMLEHRLAAQLSRSVAAITNMP